MTDFVVGIMAHVERHDNNPALPHLRTWPRFSCHFRSYRIANNARSSEPHSTVSDLQHYDGLLHAPKAVPFDPAEATQADSRGDSLTSMGRSLQDYALVVEGAS
jgi:hypothetical protein